MSILVVVQFTVRFPAIVTSSGNPIVAVAPSLPEPDTLISLVVPLTAAI